MNWKIKLKQLFTRRKTILLVVIFAVLLVLIIVPYALPLEKPKYNSGAEIPQYQQGEFININGYTTFVVDMQPPGKPIGTITFIHGFGGSTYSWRNELEYFKDKGYRTIAIDLKGFGLSDKTLDTDYSHEAQAQFIKKILDALDVSKTTIVGHSMGGNIVAYFAELYPEMLDKLVIVDGTVIESNSFSLDSLLNIAPIQQWYRVFADDYVEKDYFNSFLTQTFYDPSKRTQTDINTYHLPLEIKGWEDSLIGIIRDSSDNALPIPASEIKLPTLIIWGKEDGVAGVVSAQRLNDEMTNSKLEFIDNSGHVPMEEQPEQFNKVLLDYLSAK